MTLVKSNPALVREFVPTSFTDLIDNFFKETAEVKANSVLSFSPKVDVAEDDTKYELHLALAGIPKEHIKIEVQDGKLIVSGERKFEKKEEGKKFHRIETQYGSFHRSFYVPEKTNLEAIEAQFKDGVLTVVIPKDEKKAIKTSIQIK